MRYSLLTLLIVGMIAGALIGLKMSRLEFVHCWENQHELDHQVEFLGSKCQVLVCFEDGEDYPTQRQIKLLKKTLRATNYDVMDDASESHRKRVDAMVGLDEYGLGHINRANIREHYSVGMIVIPKLDSSSDDYVIFGCSCEWEEEHGMQIILMNGDECVYFGGDEPWGGNSDPSAFVAKFGKRS